MPGGGITQPRTNCIGQLCRTSKNNEAFISSSATESLKALSSSLFAQMNTMRIFHIPWFMWAVSNAALAKDKSDFVQDLIAEYNLFLPTIVFSEYAPDLCMTHQRIHCLSTDETNSKGLTEHIVNLQNKRKQDALIILGIEGHQQLMTDLAHMAPTFFSSNCPVFMPMELSDLMTLRFDSNIIFYEEKPDMISIMDKFAVKGGAPITLNLGTWDMLNGFHFVRAKSRWDRRRNLNGAPLVYCIYGPMDRVMELIKDDQGNFIGSTGFWPAILHLVADNLNVTTKTKLILPVSWQKLKNGTWMGAMGLLQSKKVDAVVRVTINLERTSVVDFPIPVRREAITLMSAIPRGNTRNMWGYVRVFGVAQWTIFLALLMTLGFGLYATTSVNTLRRENTESSSMKYALSDFSTALLFVLQMGEHTSVNKLATRLISMTMAMLTFLMFLYYNCVITAEMTSGPPGIPVNNFEDVLFYGYRVTTYSPNYQRQLATEEPGTAKHRVYEKYLKEKELKNSVESVNAAFMETLEDPKTLIYGAVGIISPYSR